MAPSEALRRGSAADVRAALLAARARTLSLAEDYRAALGPALAIPHRSGLNPPLWELGHVAWFQEWWIARNPQWDRGAGCDPEVVRRDSLLPASDACYDSGRVAHATRWDLSLPDFDGTLAYLARTLERTLAVLDVLPPDGGDDALYFFRLVALHEEMHVEAAVYMARALGIPVTGVRAFRTYSGAEELELGAQRFLLGSPAEGFAFDNELNAHEVAIGHLRIDAHVVTWERFLPFVEAGGSGNGNGGSGSGSGICSGSGSGSGMRYAVPADLREPVVHVTAQEAQAWCRWAGRRLPTEAEWECAALTLPGFAWGEVWEWTSSAFAPYPGFVPHPYLDYSQPWFGTRRVLRGACAATAASLAHPRYRNYFEPERSDIFAGFRSCRDVAPC